MKVFVFSAREYEKKFLGEGCGKNHILCFAGENLSPATASLAHGSDAALLFVDDDACAESIAELKTAGIRFLALRSSGYDHVNIGAARKMGIKVAHVPGYSPHAIAEHAVALLLGLNRKLVTGTDRQRLMNFSLEGLVGLNMHGSTAGIIGTGRIGSVMAKILHGFGCRVLAFDQTENKEIVSKYNVEYVPLDTLFEQSGIITLHVPLNPATKYLVNEKSIAKMKPGVLLINTARGGVVQTTALIEALKSGKIGGYGMDVYENEAGIFFEDRSSLPLQDDLFARLMTFPNVLISGHRAFLTTTALKNIAATTGYNLDCFASGKKSEFELT